MGEFFQVIIFIIIFFRILAWFNKMAGKGKSKPSSNGKNPFEQIQEQLKELEHSFEEAAKPNDTAIEHLDKKTGEKTKKSKTPHLDRMRKPVSLEITEAPYSNLEEGILDKVHRSKFEHHDAKGYEQKENKKVNILKDFDPKKAFIHSLIFNRKHFSNGDNGMENKF